ncbi:zeta toxin family protein [Leucobacter sp. HY1910]
MSAAFEPLEARQLDEIYRRAVSPMLFDGRAHEHEQPELLIVGGQPGAGKTTIIRDRLNLPHGTVPIIGDELRRFHPRYDELLQAGPCEMPRHTDQALGAWVSRALDEALRRRAHVALEVTLRTEAVLITAHEYAEHGYAVRLNALAVPRARSLVSLATRYLQQHTEHGHGHLTRLEKHDAAYDEMPATVHALRAAGVLDQVILSTRQRPRGVPCSAAAGGVAGELDRIRHGFSPTATWRRTASRAADGLAGLHPNDPDAERLTQAIRALLDTCRAR